LLLVIGVEDTFNSDLSIPIVHRLVVLSQGRQYHDIVSWSVVSEMHLTIDEKNSANGPAWLSAEILDDPDRQETNDVTRDDLIDARCRDDNKKIFRIDEHLIPFSGLQQSQA
jgi:hypothetical protein